MKKIVIDLMQADLKVINKKEDFVSYINVLNELIDLKSKNKCELFFCNKNELTLGDDIITHSDIFIFQDKNVSVLKSDIMRIEDSPEATYVYIVNDQFVLNDTPRSGFRGLFALDKKTNSVYTLDISTGEVVFGFDFNNEKAIVSHYPSTYSSRLKTLYKNIENRDLKLEHYFLNDEFINLVHIDNKEITATLKDTTLEYIHFSKEGDVKEFIVNKKLKEKISKSIDLETAKSIIKKLDGEKSVEKIDIIFNEIKELENFSILLNDSFEIKTMTTLEIKERIQSLLHNAITIKDMPHYMQISGKFFKDFYKMTESKEKRVIDKKKSFQIINVVDDFEESLDSINFNIKNIVEMSSLIDKKDFSNIHKKEKNNTKKLIK